MRIRCPHCRETIGLPNPSREIITRFIQVLKECGGNRAETARRLGMSLRGVRYRIDKFRALGLEIPGPRAPEPIAVGEFVEKWGARFPD